MSLRALDVRLGAAAARSIAEQGWRAADIGLLLGASGGPKWLILGHLDRVLFREFLGGPRSAPLRAVGSSVGSWRHACLAQCDPAAALQRFEDIYVNWEYSARPDADEVSRASAAMLAHIFQEDGAANVVDHPRLHSYIVTARGRGLNASRRAAGLALGMGTAALANAVDRRLLQGSFQRVVFANPAAPTLPLAGFDTTLVPLTTDSVAAALHASGSIPFVLTGERDIAGAPPGQYWDGGIIDYHFDVDGLGHSAADDAALILYPHFRGDLTTGWFDKFLPWRRQRPPAADRLILMHPSAAFIASLPGGKIPDRGDFTAMTPADRLSYWRVCIDRSRELADDFARLITQPDPLAHTRPLSGNRP